MRTRSSITTPANPTPRSAGAMSRWPIALALLVSAMAAQSQSTYTWNGASSTSGNWSDTANWGGASMVPQAYLNFDGSTRTASTNDFTSGTPAFQIYFKSTAGAFGLYGNSLNFFDFTSVDPNIQNEGATSQTNNFAIFNGNTHGVNGILNINLNAAPARGPLVFNGTISALDANVAIRALNINGGTVALNGVISDFSSSGKTALTLLGGTTTINAANTYSGATSVQAGTLLLNQVNALGFSAASVSSGAALQVANNASGYITSGTFTNSVTINGTGGTYGALQFVENGGNYTWSGPITLGSASRIAGFGSANTITLSGGITGGFDLALFGQGGLSTHSQIFVISGAKATYGGNTSLDAYSSSATIKLSAGADSLPTTTVLTLKAGTINGTCLAALDLNGNAQTLAGLTTTAGIGGGTGVNWVTNSASTTAAVLTLNNASASSYAGLLAGNVSLIKQNSGTFTLSGANTYAGPTMVNGGTLSISSDGNLGAVPQFFNATNVVLNGGTLSASASITLSSYRGIAVGPTSGSGTGNLDAASGQTLTYLGVVANNSAGTGGLTKTGSGTVTLLGANTYTGPTTVSAGKLILTPAATGGGSFSATAGTLGVRVLTAGTSLNMSSLTLSASTTLEINGGASGNPTVAPILVSGAVTPTATVTINFIGSGLTTGQFPLIKYGSLGGGGYAAFALGTLPQGVTANLVNNTGNSSIDLNITAISGKVWDGTTSAVWDINTTANWKTGAKYLETASGGGSVTFDDTATGVNTAVTLASGVTVSPNLLTVNSTTKTYSLSGAGKVSGNSGLTKSGTSVFTLSTSGGNDYIGDTTVNGGSLKLGAANVIPDGSGKGNLVLGGSGTLEVNGLGETINGLTGSGTVDNNSATASTLTVGGGNASGAFSGIIKNTSGAISLTKTGSGTETLGGNNTYNGATAINGGALRATNNGALGTSAGATSIAGSTSDGRLELAGGITLADAITLTEKNNTNNGVGPQYPHILNVSGNNSLSGALTLTSGGNYCAIESQSGTLTLAGGDQTANGFNRPLYLQGAGNGTISGNLTDTGLFLQIKKEGSGSWTLSGANTITKGVNVNNGTLVAGNATALGSASATVGGAGSAATLEIANVAITAPTLTLNDQTTLRGTGSGASYTKTSYPAIAATGSPSVGLTVPGSSDVLTIGSAILGGTATANLQVSGSGKVVLASGSSTGYSGSWSLGAGTLVLNNANSLGTAGRPLTISGGTLIPQNDAATTFSGNLTVSGDSALTPDRATSGAGVTHVLGTLSIGANTLTISPGANAASGSMGLTLGATTLSGDATLAINSGTAGMAVSLGAVGESGGARAFTKNGTGSLTLTADGAYSGITTINGGTVNINSAAALGSSAAGTTVGSTATVFFGGATIASAIAEPFSVAGNTGGGVLHAGGSKAYTLSGPVTLTGNTTIKTDGGAGFTFSAASAFTGSGNNLTFNLDGSVTTTVSGNISLGGGSLTKGSTSTLALTGTGNSWSGGTTIAGTLQIGSGSANGSIGTGTITDNGTLNFNSSSSFTVSDLVQGTGVLLKNGTGSLTLGLANTFAGGATLNAGTLALGNEAAVGTGTLTLAAGTLTSSSSTARNVTNSVTASGNFTLGQASVGTGSLTLSGPVNLGTAVRTITVNNPSNSITGIMSGSGGGVTKLGTGTLTLSGDNLFIGGVTISAGPLWIKHSNALGTGNKTLTCSAGTSGHCQLHLDGSGGNLTLGSGISYLTSNAADPGTVYNEAGDNIINGAFTLTGGGGSTIFLVKADSLTLNGNIAANQSGRAAIFDGPGLATLNGVLSDGGAWATALTRQGAGKTVINANNTYSGATTVSGGTLALSASGSISNSATISVVAGATFDVSAVSGFAIGLAQTLKGNGTVVGNSIVNGTIAAGSSIGTLTNVGNLTWAPGGTNQVEIGKATGTPGLDWDNLIINGDLVISPTNQPIASQKFTIALAAIPGGVTGFVNTVSYTWPIATVSGTVYGFNAGKFLLNTNAFTNDLGGGSLSVVLADKSVELVFTPAGSCATLTSATFTNVSGNLEMTFANASGLTSVQALTMSNCTITGVAYDSTGNSLGIGYVTNDMRTSLVGLGSPIASTVTGVVLTATKTISGNPAAVNAIVIDTCGRGKSFDPVITTLTVASGSLVQKRFEGLLSAEHYLRVVNASPGLKWLEINLNGRVFRLDPLVDAQEVSADLFAAMHEGDNNVVILTGYGDVGASALVMITDTASDGLVSLPEIVTLGLSQSPGGLVLAWPDTLTGWSLQSSDFPDTNWTAVNTVPVSLNSQLTVTVPTTEGARFYRLAGPVASTNASRDVSSQTKISVPTTTSQTLPSTRHTYDGILW